MVWYELDMESEENEVVRLSVSHGPDKYNVELPLTTVVRQLSQRLEELTGVPTGGQKLIHRGKHLQDPEQTLNAAGLKQGSKLMLIGKKTNPEEDENYKAIVEVEKKSEAVTERQTEIKEEVDGVQQGYLQKDQEKDSLSRLDKRLATCHEEYVRLIERLDSLDMSSSNQAIRGKRKSVIVAIQKHLEVNDVVDATIKRLQDPSGS
ncbi:BAG family molecular chaperone regulator 1-like [Diadema setosum]|uniref:BAG family molecular chaperone regulator 1-like n=1 Tax=Diadema setosum TaxID=31175 RepID=UPI003B3B202A